METGHTLGKLLVDAMLEVKVHTQMEDEEKMESQRSGVEIVPANKRRGEPEPRGEHPEAEKDLMQMSL